MQLRIRDVVASLLPVWTLFALSGCAADLATVQKTLEPHYRMYRPDGSGPFPAVMLVPGCGGVMPGGSTARLRTAEQLGREGYVVVFVDYVSARGLTSPCRGEVRPEEIAQDIVASAGHLRSLPFVKPASIGVIGWSLGGGGGLAALEALRQDQPLPFRALATYYPVCGGRSPWRSRIPTLILVGDLDDITPPWLCEELAKRIPRESPVELRVYPGARHSFDIPGLPVGPSALLGGGVVGYDVKAASDAWEELKRFLKRHFAAG